jgi:hypothetical protein
MSSHVRVVAVTRTHGVLWGSYVYTTMNEYWQQHFALRYPVPVNVLAMPRWKQLLWKASKTNGQWQVFAYREPRHTRFKRSKYWVKAESLGVVGKKVNPRNKPHYPKKAKAKFANVYAHQGEPNWIPANLAANAWGIGGAYAYAGQAQQVQQPGPNVANAANMAQFQEDMVRRYVNLRNIQRDEEL